MPPSLSTTFLQVSVVATVISDINIVDNISYKVVDADFSDRKFEMMFTVKVSAKHGHNCIVKVIMVMAIDKVNSYVKMKSMSD